MHTTSFSAALGTPVIALPAARLPQEVLEDILALGNQHDASDIHLTGGLPAYLRVHNDIVPAGKDCLSENTIMGLAAELMTEPQRRVFQQRQQLDLAFFSTAGTRYRANVYRQRGVTAIALRRLDSEFRDLHALNLPPQLA